MSRCSCCLNGPIDVNVNRWILVSAQALRHLFAAAYMHKSNDRSILDRPHERCLSSARHLLAGRLPAHMSPATPSLPLIGVFDSGVGGLSVLKALREQRPDIPLLYIADSGHAPYGERDVAHVVDRSLRITRYLVDQGAALVVVACNTATAAAIEAMRAEFPALTLVGVEPGVKPAAAQSPTHRIGVMATPSTLTSPRFATLVARHAPDCLVVPMPCPGLAAAIEGGRGSMPMVRQLLDQFCGRLAAEHIDNVVLGCTHYPFVADEIAERLGPQVQILDTASAVARQAIRLYHRAPQAGPGSVHLVSTGDGTVLQRLAAERMALVASVCAVQI